MWLAIKASEKLSAQALSISQHHRYIALAHCASKWRWDMSADLKKTREDNIDLLRSLHGGNNRLAAMLREHPNYVSDRARGKKGVLDYSARTMEQKLSYPDGWFDRDNLSLLKMSRDDHETVSLLLSAPPEKRAAIRTLLDCATENPFHSGSNRLKLVKT
jgi:hypothetical protein